MFTKKQLAIQLSKLKRFENPKIQLEQYTTDSEIAGTVLWDAMMKGDIADKTIADLGAGTGILGIGALLIGAKHVYFVEKDNDAIKILKENLALIEDTRTYTIIHKEINEFDTQVDTVLQNPPFGTQQVHADKPFLEKAFSIAKAVYSFHKTTTDSFVRAIASDFKFKIAETYAFLFPLRNTYSHHTKKVEKIEVVCYKLVKG
ncbi:MAG: METTL5 family protein [Candidatus Woesearchaeota archaeon]|jgi:putative methylase